MGRVIGRDGRIANAIVRCSAWRARRTPRRAGDRRRRRLSTAPLAVARISGARARRCRPRRGPHRLAGHLGTGRACSWRGSPRRAVVRAESGGRILAVTLAGIASRDDAERLVGRYLEVEAQPLEDGRYYWDELSASPSATRPVASSATWSRSFAPATPRSIASMGRTANCSSRRAPRGERDRSRGRPDGGGLTPKRFADARPFGPMRFDVVTLFPELFEVPLRTSILGRAAERGLEFAIHDLREHGLGRHRPSTTAVRRRAGWSCARSRCSRPSRRFEPPATVVLPTRRGSRSPTPSPASWPPCRGSRSCAAATKGSTNGSQGRRPRGEHRRLRPHRGRAAGAGRRRCGLAARAGRSRRPRSSEIRSDGAPRAPAVHAAGVIRGPRRAACSAGARGAPCTSPSCSTSTGASRETASTTTSAGSSRQ